MITKPPARRSLSIPRAAIALGLVVLALALQACGKPGRSHAPGHLVPSPGHLKH